MLFVIRGVYLIVNFHGVEVDDYFSYFDVYNGDSSIAFQPLFDIFLRASSYFLPYDFVRLSIGLLVLSMMAWSLRSITGWLFYITIGIFAWYSFPLLVVHLRMGLGVSIVYMFTTLKYRYSAWMLIVPLVHYSTAIAIVVLKVFRNRLWIFIFAFLGYVCLSYAKSSDFGKVYSIEDLFVINDFVALLTIFILYFLVKRRFIFSIIYLAFLFFSKLMFDGELSARLPAALMLFFPLLYISYEKNGSLYRKSRA